MPNPTTIKRGLHMKTHNNTREAEKRKSEKMGVVEETIENLKKIEGENNELLSLYIPINTDLDALKLTIINELEETHNITEEAARFNVQRSLARILHYVCELNSKIYGYGVFASPYKLWICKAYVPNLKSVLYWADNSFLLVRSEKGVKREVEN